MGSAQTIDGNSMPALFETEDQYLIDLQKNAV